MAKMIIRPALIAMSVLSGGFAAAPASSQGVVAPPVTTQHFNPTVLAPASRGTLPQGTVVVSPPRGRAGHARPQAESVQNWQNALPAHRHHHHYRPTGDDHH